MTFLVKKPEKSLADILRKQLRKDTEDLVRVQTENSGRTESQLAAAEALVRILLKQKKEKPPVAQ